MPAPGSKPELRRDISDDDWNMTMQMKRYNLTYVLIYIYIIDTYRVLTCQKTTQPPPHLHTLGQADDDASSILASPL